MINIIILLSFEKRKESFGIMKWVNFLHLSTKQNIKKKFNKFKLTLYFLYFYLYFFCIFPFRTSFEHTQHNTTYTNRMQRKSNDNNNRSCIYYSNIYSKNASFSIPQIINRKNLNYDYYFAHFVLVVLPLSIFFISFQLNQIYQYQYQKHFAHIDFLSQLEITCLVSFPIQHVCSY